MFWGTAYRAHGATLMQMVKGIYPLPVKNHVPVYVPISKTGGNNKKWSRDEDEYLIGCIGLMTNRQISQLMTDNGWKRTDEAVRHRIKILRRDGKI